MTIKKEEISKPDNFTMQEFIDWLQRYIIVHSYNYYEGNRSYITDKKYDTVCKQLVALKNEYPNLWETSEYYKQFGKDYNGATGFTLYHELDEHQKKIIDSLIRK